MDAFIKLGSLELCVASNLANFSESDRVRISALAKESEQLQLDVFKQHKVPSPSSKVLPAEEMVGGPGTAAQLDGSSPTYHMLFLTGINGHLLGITATEEKEVDGLGHIVMVYFPPLVLKEHAYVPHVVNLADMAKATDKPANIRVSLTARAILLLFTAHLTKAAVDYAGRFTDGLGIAKLALRPLGYKRSAAPIWVPPQDAETMAEYNQVQRQPVHPWMNFSLGNEPRLTEAAAAQLFVEDYLKGGYVDPEKVSDARANRLKSAVMTRKAIREIAAAHNGYIPFK